MTCAEVQKLLTAYTDGELDLVRNLVIEQHIQDCGDCQKLYQSQQNLRKALRTGSLYYAPPPGLDKRIHKVLLKENKPVRAAGWSRRWLAIPVALVIFLGIGWVIVQNLTGASKTERLSQEVVAGHVRSLMVNHLADVISTDQHTVKPWFNGKLDFAPTVEDFSDKGFPLAGGRLDYLDNRPVAALVYHRREHTINLFIWPTETGSPRLETQNLTRQGYQLFYWAKGSMNYWVISDLNGAELADFVKLVQSQ